MCGRLPVWPNLEPNLGLGVEGVGCGVGGSEDFAVVLRIATGAGRVASVGIGTADQGDSGECAIRGSGRSRREQQPGNAARVGGRGLLEGFAGDGAAILPLPGGSGEVSACALVCRWIEESGFGSLKDPGKGRALSGTPIDLYATTLNGVGEMGRGGRQSRICLLRCEGESEQDQRGKHVVLKLAPAFECQVSLIAEAPPCTPSRKVHLYEKLMQPVRKTYARSVVLIGYEMLRNSLLLLPPFAGDFVLWSGVPLPGGRCFLEG